MTDDRFVPARVPASYDAVAAAYAAQIGDELAAKPLDRALLDTVVELVRSGGHGPIADVGCGPGHVTAYLAARGADALGVDISAGMIAVARARAPHLDFRVGSMRRLPCEDGSLAAVVAFYSLIHLTAGERAQACRDFARALRPGGWVLAAFHVEDADHHPGSVSHLDAWFGSAVDLDFYFLDPALVRSEFVAAGFAVQAQVDREPLAGVEHPSRRCYLLARR